MARLWIGVLIRLSVCLSDVVPTSTPGLPTVTVRGFLNFKTTVDGTVIVFTPVSEQQPHTITKTTTQLSTKEEQTLSTNNNALHQHSNALEPKDAMPANNIEDLSFTKTPTAVEPVKPDLDDLVHHGQKEKEPFHHHISDNAVLPSTIQTDNDLETDVNKKASSSYNHYPTGLVTVLDGTHVENGRTTIFETRVVGTYIDGKYAQILQSTSKIIGPTKIMTPSHQIIVSSKSVESSTVTSITPSSTISEVTITSTNNGFVSSSTMQTLLSPAINELTSSSHILTSKTESAISSSHTLTSKTESATSTSSVTADSEVSSSTTVLQSSFEIPEVTVKSIIGKPTQSLESVKTRTFSKYSSTFNIELSSTTQPTDTEDPLLLSSKSLRTSSTRIRFTAPKRPSQTVRLNRFKVKLSLRQNSTDGYEITTSPEDEELEEEDSSKEEEEQNAEISTEVLDPSNVVYQETTITSEVTLHVGRRKSVRTLTITTSVPKRISATDFDGIIMTDSLYDIEQDHEAQENIPATHSVITRTYSTTERTHTTSLVQVYDGKGTTFHTLTESFFIMKIITAYRTLPPGDVTILSPTAIDDPHVPIEIPTTTLDVAANVLPSVIQPPQEQQTTEKIPTTTEDTSEPSVPTPAIVTPNINQGITNPLLSFGQALSNNPLAAVYLGLQQLNAQMTFYTTITQTATIVETDTIYSTKTIRFYDGRSTKFRTSSEPISTKKRTVTTTITSVQPYINTQAYQQQQQLQKLIAATQVQKPMFSTQTSVYTTSTTVTSLSTRIYTLIYNGFSTKFRTVTSTKLHPTVLTVTSTKEIPISPTQPPLLPFAYPYPAA